MPDPQELRPATAEEVTESLSFALRYDGRRPVVEHLERSGCVVMKRPPADAPRVPK
jgi:hypothetical protein